jgi:hypothetical protein
MAENGRINKMKGILNAFDKLMSAHRGEVLCTVTTAKVIKYVLILTLLKPTKLALYLPKQNKNEGNGGCHQFYFNFTFGLTVTITILGDLW